MEQKQKKTIVVAELQPVVAEGLRSVVGAAGDLQFIEAVASLPAALDSVRRNAPSALVVDKGFGSQALLTFLAEMKIAGLSPAVMVWGASMTEAEALRFVQSGAKGIIRKSAGLGDVLLCLRSTASGVAWVERELFRGQAPGEIAARPVLTMRERQIVELVSQGLKNREIAQELGIRPGTVKVHLKHIFEKTGIRGRYGLALSGLEGNPYQAGAGREREKSIGKPA